MTPNSGSATSMDEPSSYTHYAPATPNSIQMNDPRFYQVVHFAIGLTNPIDVDSMKSFFSNSILMKLPRFTSLLVKKDSRRQYWKPVKVDIDRHFVVVPGFGVVEDDGVEDAVNEYLAELASAPPMSVEKPLWEIHLLLHLRRVVLRLHHALGDGTSFASLITDIGCSGTGESGAKERLNNNNNKKRVYRRRIWSSMVFSAQFAVKFFLVRDKKTVLRGDKCDLNRPHKIATARFSLSDVNLVKKAIPNATINDVICGILWGGFLKYIDAQPFVGPLKEGQQITGLILANLRQRLGLLDVSKLVEENTLESLWGNKIGIFLLPLYYTKKIQNPLEFIRKAKTTLDKKKQSIEPRFTVNFRDLVLRLCGVKVVNYLNERGWSNMTFRLSNVVGPPMQISFDGNPTKMLKFSLSAAPLGISISLISYNSNLELQILTSEDVISDPKILASCFRSTLQEMKDVLSNQSSQAID